jgi:hypothetical protein
MRLLLLAALACGCSTLDPSDLETGESEVAAAPTRLDCFSKDVIAAASAARAQLPPGRPIATWAMPIPPVPVSTQDDLAARMLEYVSAATRRQVPKADAKRKDCNGPGRQTCANLFQNDVFHSDGLMGNALHPLAQQIDRESRTVNLTTYKSAGQRAVIATAGIYDNRWLMGLAFFDSPPPPPKPGAPPVLQCPPAPTR